MKISLYPGLFSEREKTLISDDNFEVRVFRYDTGVDAVRLINRRGELIVLPYLGQMIWDARFDDVRLTMDSMFDVPRPAPSILGTYGCLSYHAGILSNGNPSADDDHAVHGELPCARVDKAWLEFGCNEAGAFVRLAGDINYAQGFGAHYHAHLSVTLGAQHACFDIGLSAKNLSASPMTVMYLCHLNFAFCEGARIVQPAPFTCDRTMVRSNIPAHVPKTAPYTELVSQLALDPSLAEVLEDPRRFSPEQVFYIREPGKSDDGLAHFMLQRIEGDGFTVAYDPSVFTHTIRWLLFNGDMRVAAFALPATCEPEGYLAEKRKGNVRSLESGKTIHFRVRAGYVDRNEAALLRQLIARHA